MTGPMVTREQVREALRGVMDPELKRNLVELGMVRQVDLTGRQVQVTLALTTLACPLKDRIVGDARQAVLALDGVEQMEVRLTEMSVEEKERLRPKEPASGAAADLNDIRHVIAVMSGKGGVGKSSVTAMLAVELARQGQKVGILDADITGASIPKLFGLPAGGLRGGDMGILPAITPLGIRIVSSNLMLKEEDISVAWRGPLIAGMIQKFWDDVLWGKLDTLLVDLPPGTSDATITVMQNLPIKGVMLVTTPQELSGLVVRKAAHLLNRLDIPILGIVENMSFFHCPGCNQDYSIFGPSHSAQLATDFQTTLVARLPVDPDIAELCDQGKVEKVQFPEIIALATQILERT